MAQTFTDDNGKDWTVKINPVTLARIEDELGVSFSKPPEDEDSPILRIVTDCMFCFRVLWILVEAQATERGIASEDFGDLLIGDTLGRAQGAICEGLADFHPSAERRNTIRRMLGLVKETEARLVKRANDQLDGFDIDAALQEITTDGS